MLFSETLYFLIKRSRLLLDVSKNFLFRKNAQIGGTVYCPAEEGHVAKSKVQMEAGQDRGQPILWQYWSGRCSSSPVLLCSGDCLCLLYCDRCGGEGEAGAGLVNTGEQELGQEGGELLYF